MTQHAPNLRMPVKTYRTELESSGVFPKYFGTALYELFLNIHWKGATPDDRIGIICQVNSLYQNFSHRAQNFSNVMEHIAGCLDSEGNQFFETAMQKFAPHSKSVSVDESSVSVADIFSARKRKSDVEVSIKPLKSKRIVLDSKNERTPLTTSEKNVPQKVPTFGNRDIAELIEQFERLLDEARKDTSTNLSSSIPPLPKKCSSDAKSKLSLRSYYDCVFEARGVWLKLFEVDPDENELSNEAMSSSSISHFADRYEDIQKENVARSFRRSSDSSGLLLIIQLICSTIRHLRCPHSKVISLMLLTRFGVLLNDSVILQRVVPFIMLCIEDSIAIVRATAIRCLRALLSAVTEVSHTDSSIWKDFLFPILNNVIAKENEAIVRVALAESIGRFAETSMRFLDSSRFNAQIKLNPSVTNPSGSIESAESGTTAPSTVFVDGSFDAQVNFLHDQVSKWIRDLVLDGNMMNSDRNEGRARMSLNSHSSIVKRAILEDIVRLCVLFGKQDRIMDLFAQLLAYVNHTVSDQVKLADHVRIGKSIGNYEMRFVQKFL